MKNSSGSARTLSLARNPSTSKGLLLAGKFRRLQMRCSHAHQIKTVTPSALGCEDCLRMGSPWVHLRLCRSCGHVGCCDQSPNRHARRHLKRPVIRLSRATTLPRDGAGAISMTSKSTWQAGRRTTVRSRASSETAPKPTASGQYTFAHNRPAWASTMERMSPGFVE